MEPEAPTATASKRPRPILWILLGIAAVAFLVMRLGGSAGPGQPASSGPGAARQARADTAFDPSVLDVKIESLQGGRPAPAGTARNPFRFQPKAAPPPEGRPQGFTPGPEPLAQVAPSEPPVPPITVKFLGTLEVPGGTVLAVFTDCSQGGRRTKPFREGESVFGQYRLVKIGLQSVVIEHLDGRGRTTLPKTGQECVWK